LIQFEVFPVNIHQVDHSTGSDWARKEIAGAATYREWVGENDEEIHLRGKVFPHFMSAHLKRRGTNLDAPRGSGGLTQLDMLDNMRKLGEAQLLVRGDGWSLGWFVIEKLSRSDTFLGAEGIGQMIEFDATFQRVPVPDPNQFFPSLWSALQ
jgi:phage protein U